MTVLGSTLTDCILKHPSYRRQFLYTATWWKHLTWDFADILKQVSSEDEDTQSPFPSSNIYVPSAVVHPIPGRSTTPSTSPHITSHTYPTNSVGFRYACEVCTAANLEMYFNSAAATTTGDSLNLAGFNLVPVFKSARFVAPSSPGHPPYLPLGVSLNHGTFVSVKGIFGTILVRCMIVGKSGCVNNERASPANDGHSCVQEIRASPQSSFPPSLPLHPSQPQG
uniref:Uncharacterized protein n=1 Tax=Timema shepardi TaxID=629360 RepID=A0A7R9B2J9_TIMSH|nr:unnamed protein product [Timema shepardi]